MIDVSRVSLWLELTPYCNLACSFCYNPWRGGPLNRFPGRDSGQRLTADLVARLVSQWKFDYVAFSGGEPLLAKELDSMVTVAAEHGQRSVLTTNGVLLSASRLEKLVDRGLSEVQISITGLSPRVYDELAGRRSWRRAFGSILLAVESGCPASVTCVVTRQNYREVPRLTSLLARIGVHNLVLNQVNEVGSAADGSCSVSRETFRIVVENAREMTGDSGMGIKAIYPMEPEGALGIDGAAPWHRIAVDPSGEVKLCNQSAASVANLATVCDSGLREILSDLASGVVSEYVSRTDSCMCLDARFGRREHVSSGP